MRTYELAGAKSSLVSGTISKQSYSQLYAMLLPTIDKMHKTTKSNKLIL